MPKEAKKKPVPTDNGKFRDDLNQTDVKEQLGAGAGENVEMLKMILKMDLATVRNIIQSDEHLRENIFDDAHQVDEFPDEEEEISQWLEGITDESSKKILYYLENNYEYEE